MRAMRRAMVVAGLLVALGASGVAVAGGPAFGICVRPLIGEGGILNLPLVDIPGKRIPNDSLEVTFGGEYSDCKMGGIGV